MKKAMASFLFIVGLAAAAPSQVPDSTSLRHNAGQSDSAIFKPGVDTLQEGLIKAQTAYYQDQASSKSTWESAKAILQTLVATIVGGSLTFLGIRWSANRQVQLEREKWEKQKSDEIYREIRQAAVAFLKILGAENQAIMYLTWTAMYNPLGFSQKHIDKYNGDMESLFVDDVAAQALLSALDFDCYNKLRPIIDSLEKMDHEISLITEKFSESMHIVKRQKVLSELGEWHEKAKDFFEEARGKFKDILPNKR
jgi:hypothetical protein